MHKSAQDTCIALLPPLAKESTCPHRAGGYGRHPEQAISGLIVPHIQQIGVSHNVGGCCADEKDEQDEQARERQLQTCSCALCVESSMLMWHAVCLYKRF